MRRSSNPTRSAMRTFGAPGALGLFSALGLVSALLGDGLWDAMSWATLALPAGVAGFFALGRAGRSQPPRTTHSGV
jgi:hypothetical protein